MAGPVPGPPEGGQHSGSPNRLRDGGPPKLRAKAEGGHEVGWRVASGFVALTLVLTWPLVLNPAGSVLSKVPDTDLYMWTLAWDTHALTHQPLAIFDANIYYPQRRTLAYSENLLGDVVFAAPVLWLTGNPVLALNVTALATCLLCGLGAYVLARRVGVGTAGAVICGLVFAFSPPRFLRLGQLHLTSIHWIPFTLASLHAYLDDGRRRDLRLAAGFFSLQALSSGHGAVFVTIAAAGLLVYRFALGEPLALVKRARDFGLAGALILAPAILVMVPYLAVQQETGLRRSLEDWAVPASSFLASPTHVHRFLLTAFSRSSVNRDALAFLFPGYLPLVLAAAALVRREPPLADAPPVSRGDVWHAVAVALEIIALACLAVVIAAVVHGPFRLRVNDLVLVSVRAPWRAVLVLAGVVVLRASLGRRAPFSLTTRLRHALDRRRRLSPPLGRDARTFYFLLLMLGLWLSIGPPLSLWPAVYWLPGMNLIRVPSRFTLMAMIGLAVLAGVGFDRLTRGLAPARRIASAWLVGALLVAEFVVIPFGTSPFRVDIPPVDRWLDSQPKPFAIAEVPIPPLGDGGAWDRRQTEYMLHAMAHWQKTVHGYSGMRLPLHEDLYQKLRTFPDARSLDALRQLAVTYVVVHTDLYPEGQWPIVEGRMDEYRDSLRLEHADGAGRVYSLRPAMLNAND